MSRHESPSYLPPSPIIEGGRKHFPDITKMNTNIIIEPQKKRTVLPDIVGGHT